MDSEIYITNINAQQKYSNDTSQHEQSQNLPSNEQVSVQLIEQNLTEDKEFLNESLPNQQAKYLKNTKWGNIDNYILQDMYQNEPHLACTLTDQTSQGHHHASYRQEDQDNYLIPYQGSLNMIHDNLQDSHIGQFNDKMTIQQNYQTTNTYLNINKVESNPQYSLVSAQYFNEYNTHPSLQNMTYSNISLENQQIYNTPQFTDKKLNTQSELYHEQMELNLKQQKQQQQYDYEFGISPQPLIHTNQFEESLPDELHDQDQIYYQYQYTQNEGQDKNKCHCYNSFYQQSLYPQIRDEENKLSFQNYLGQNIQYQQEESKQFFQKEGTTYLNNIFEVQQENPNYIKTANQQQTSCNVNKDYNVNTFQLSKPFEEDSYSKSQQSDEQFLMNQSFAESSQSIQQIDQTYLKNLQNTGIHNDQVLGQHEIMGKFNTSNEQNELRFIKKDKDFKENQGDLVSSDIFDNQNNSHNFQNLLTKIDFSLQSEKISTPIRQKKQINQKKINENHSQFQSLLKVFFPQQESSNLGDKSDQQQEVLDIIHLDKKNIVRNLIRAFIRFLFNKNKFPLIHQQYFSNLTENEAKQHIRKYFSKKKFNNFIIKQIVSHQVYGVIFKNFLENEAINYLQHSNVKCKQNHQKFITFLLKCYDDNNLLEILETYSKNKKA